MVYLLVSLLIPTLPINIIIPYAIVAREPLEWPKTHGSMCSATGYRMGNL